MHLHANFLFAAINNNLSKTSVSWFFREPLYMQDKDAE